MQEIGGVTKLIVDRLKGARDSMVIGIDQSAEMLRVAMENLNCRTASAVQFVQSHVEHVSETVKESADTVFFCNAIHYVPDKGELLTEIGEGAEARRAARGREEHHDGY